MKASQIEKLENSALKVTSWIGSIWSLIIHTIVFIGSFILVLFGVPFDRVLLVLTTALSLEAIYLSIFIQMSVNRNTQAIASVEKDVEEMQEDVEEMTHDVEEMHDDVEEMREEVKEIAEDVEEVQEDLGEMREDVEEIAEDIEEISEHHDESGNDHTKEAKS